MSTLARLTLGRLVSPSTGGETVVLSGELDMQLPEQRLEAGVEAAEMSSELRDQKVNPNLDAGSLGFEITSEELILDGC
ncbi:MAG: hypothetical protein AAGC81_01930 [Pseudomonadota bacterium]